MKKLTANFGTMELSIFTQAVIQDKH